MNHQCADWKAESVAVEGVLVDVGFLVQEAFYYGPENGFTPRQRQELQDKLYKPDLRKSGSFVLSADILGKERELSAHYKDVVAKAKDRGKSLHNSSHFWNRPVIYSPNLFYLSFPWHDRFREGRRLLQALLKGAEGEVFSDIDQGWQLDIELFDGVMYAREGDPDERTFHCNVKFEYSPIRAQVEELLRRVERLIAHLTSELGEDNWT